jgi:hypothetical protein
VARELGATVERFTGVGHWWMLQDPARGAALLRGFWAAHRS